MQGVLKKHDRLIKPGMRLEGKWHHKRYNVIKKLGEGAIGTVYLCAFNGRYYALKISDTASSMTVEVNVLKSLEKVQGQQLGPYLLDVDDWQSPAGITFSFYVMEYVQGEPLAHFIKQHGTEWIGVFLLQLLRDLEQLHQAGWVFGDLKLENLLITSAPARIRWVDVGGVTKIGRSIKEYTEYNDRGYWGMGSRKAEPSYDLFAITMVFLNLFYPRRFTKAVSNEQLLCSKIDTVKVFTPYRHCFKKAIKGKYQSSEEMRREVAAALQKQRRKSRPQQQSARRKINGRPASYWLEGGGLLMAATGFYALSLLFS